MLGSGARHILINTHFSVEMDRRGNPPRPDACAPRLSAGPRLNPPSLRFMGTTAPRPSQKLTSGGDVKGGTSGRDRHCVSGRRLCVLCAWGGAGWREPGGLPGTPSGTGRAAVLRWCRCGSGCHCPTSSGRATREGETAGAVHVQGETLALLGNCFLLKPGLRSGACGVSLQLD